MQIGEILDGSFNIYRRHFGLFMRLSGVLIGVPAVVGVYLFARFASNPTAVSAWTAANIGATIGLFVLALLVAAVVSVLLKGGTVKIISDSYLGHEPSLRAALQFGVSRITPMLLVALSKFLLVLLIYFVEVLVVMLFVTLARAGGPGLTGLAAVIGVFGSAWFLAFVLCGYALTTVVIVLEDLESSFNAFGRSWALTQGSKLKVFGVWLVMWLLTYVVPLFAYFGASMAIGPQSQLQLVLAVVWPLVNVALAPIAPCALTLVYYDLRVRREAFDLQILSDQLETR